MLWNLRGLDNLPSNRLHSITNWPRSAAPGYGFLPNATSRNCRHLIGHIILKYQSTNQKTEKRTNRCRGFLDMIFGLVWFTPLGLLETVLPSPFGNAGTAPPSADVPFWRCIRRCCIDESGFPFWDVPEVEPFVEPLFSY